MSTPGARGTAQGPDVRTRVCPHGPLLVRGATAWTDEDGVTTEVTRPVTAVCRCGRSGLKPWCDGTHSVLPHGWDDETPTTVVRTTPRPAPRVQD